MRASTVRDLSALVRSARRSQGLTQADVARLLGVSRDWVVRLEQASPRLEVQKVLDALAVLGLQLDVSTPAPAPAPAPAPTSASGSRGADSTGDPFDLLTTQT